MNFLKVDQTRAAHDQYAISASKYIHRMIDAYNRGTLRCWRQQTLFKPTRVRGGKYIETNIEAQSKFTSSKYIHMVRT